MTTLFSNPDPSTPVAAHTSPIPSTDPFQQADLGDEPDDMDEDEAAPVAPPAQTTRPRGAGRPAARR